MAIRAAIVPSVIAEVALDVAEIAANTTAEQTFTVPGLRLEHLVVVNKPTADAGAGIVGARVSDENEIAITFVNATGTPITPGEETYKIIAF